MQEEFSKPCDSKTLGRGFAEGTIVFFMVGRLSRSRHKRAHNRHEKGTKSVSFRAARQGKG
jgi:hypothetical protein